MNIKVSRPNRALILPREPQTDNMFPSAIPLDEN